MNTLAAVGDNCIDAYPALDRFVPGGNSVNVAVWFRRLGGHASYVGVVGDDRHGGRLREALGREGVDTSHVHVRPGRTAVTLVDLVNGERVFGEYDEGVASSLDLTPEDLAFVASHAAIHSGLWGHADRYLAALRAPGRPVFFDFSDRLEGALVSRVLPLVDYAFFSFPGFGPAVARHVSLARQQGPGTVVAMLGADGSLGCDGQRLVRVPAAPATLVDTMGAGDAFIAGFITARLAGDGLEACMQAGAEVAARAIACPGAW